MLDQRVPGSIPGMCTIYPPVELVRSTMGQPGRERA